MRCLRETSNVYHTLSSQDCYNVLDCRHWMLFQGFICSGFRFECNPLRPLSQISYSWTILISVYRICCCRHCTYRHSRRSFKHDNCNGWFCVRSAKVVLHQRSFHLFATNSTYLSSNVHFLCISAHFDAYETHLTQNAREIKSKELDPAVNHRSDSVEDALKRSEGRETNEKELVMLTLLIKKRSALFLRRQTLSATKGSCNLPQTGDSTSVLTLNGTHRKLRWLRCYTGASLESPRDLLVVGMRTDGRQLDGISSQWRFKSDWTSFQRVSRGCCSVLLAYFDFYACCYWMWC